MLIHHIYLGSIFIFKKIEPAELDFSIQPYELESEAWHYVTESYDLHIYYKEYKAVVDSFIIDSKEEYEVLEAIGQRRIQGNIMQVFLFLILAWFNVDGIYTNPEFLKDGAAQLTLPIILTGLTISIWSVIHIKRFLKLNRENLDAGRDIKYSDSMFLVPSTTFFLGTSLVTLFLFHFIYMGLISRSLVPFIFILIIFSMFALERVYRFWKVPDRTANDVKKIGWTGLILVLLVVGIGFGVNQETKIPKNPNLEEYRVLTIDTFIDGKLDFEGTLTRDFSILIPVSYEYYYISDQDEYVETKYGRALIKDFANDLVDRYIDEKKTDLIDIHADNIKLYFDEGIFNDFLLTGGISEGDLIRLKSLKQEDAEETAHQLIEERSITEADADIWNADQVYFLSYKKNQLLIRNGKEVFYLYGKDFSDPVVIEQTKEKLALN